MAARPATGVDLATSTASASVTYLNGYARLFDCHYAETVRLAGTMGAPDPEGLARQALARAQDRMDRFGTTAEALDYVRAVVCTLARHDVARGNVVRRLWERFVPSAKEAEPDPLAPLDEVELVAVALGTTPEGREDVIVLGYWLEDEKDPGPTLPPRRLGGLTAAMLTVLAVIIAASAALPAFLPAQADTGQVPAAAPDAVVAARSLPSSPLSERSLPAAGSAAGHLVVWGGQAIADSTHRTLLGDGAQYDPTEDAWSAIPDGPLSPRKGASAVTVGSQLVVLGGRDASGPSREAASYDVRGRDWSALPSAPNCPQTATVLNGAVYAYGGCAGGATLAALTHATSPSKAAWTRLPAAPVQDVRTLVAVDGVVVAMNGHGAVAAYHPGDGWTRLAPVPEVARGEAPELVVADSRLFALTNEDDGSSSQIWAWADGSWSEVATAPDADAGHGPSAVGSAQALFWSSESGICTYEIEQGRAECMSSPGGDRSGASLVPTGAGTYLWGGAVSEGHGLLAAEGLVLGAGA